MWESALLQVVVLATSSTCVAGLGGSHYPFDGSASSGWVTEFGNGYASGDQFGVHGSGRMYLVENLQAPYWGATDHHRFYLLGNTLSFTVDLSQVGCGMIACLYFSAMAHPSGGPNYCDIQPSAGGCFELDIMEANGFAFESSLHAHPGTTFDGSCNVMGCSTNLGRFPYTIEEPRADPRKLYGHGGRIDTGRPFQVTASFDEHELMTIVLDQDGVSVPSYNKSAAWNFPEIQDLWNEESYPKPGGIPDYEISGTVDALKGGLGMVASLWSPQDGDTHWLDQTACSSAARGQFASFVISNMKMTPTPPKAAAVIKPGEHVDCSSQPCDWTKKWSCPGSAKGSEGVAWNDHSIGFTCCCLNATGSSNQTTNVSSTTLAPNITAVGTSVIASAPSATPVATTTTATGALATTGLATASVTTVAPLTAAVEPLATVAPTPSLAAVPIATMAPAPPWPFTVPVVTVAPLATTMSTIPPTSIFSTTVNRSGSAQGSRSNGNISEGAIEEFNWGLIDDDDVSSRVAVSSTPVALPVLAALLTAALVFMVTRWRPYVWTEPLDLIELLTDQEAAPILTTT